MWSKSRKYPVVIWYHALYTKSPGLCDVGYQRINQTLRSCWHTQLHHTLANIPLYDDQRTYFKVKTNTDVYLNSTETYIRISTLQNTCIRYSKRDFELIDYYDVTYMLHYNNVYELY